MGPLLGVLCDPCTLSSRDSRLRDATSRLAAALVSSCPATTLGPHMLALRAALLQLGVPGCEAADGLVADTEAQLEQLAARISLPPY